jgi:large subunit ribosomal protein L6
MKVTIEDGIITVVRPSDIARHRALHGLTRTLINNMVEGVTAGYSKSLEIRGVGYKAEVTETGARLIVGYSHNVDYPAPEGITISVEKATLVKIEGIDKEKVGQVAAEIRGVRPPEPYKGKGIRYVGEHVRTKVGKTGAKA